MMTQEEQNALIDEMRNISRQISEIEIPAGSTTATNGTITALDALRQYGESAVPRMQRKLLQERLQELFIELMNGTLDNGNEAGRGKRFGNTWN